MSANIRTRWAAVGAAVAITLGAGGIGITNAATSSGEKPIFKPIEPCRLVDVRPAPEQVGPRSAPLGPGEIFTLSGWGAVGECNLPSGTTALSLNVTAVGATEQTFLTVYPGSGTPPKASSLNPTPGHAPTPNAVNVDLDAAGAFSVFNNRGNVNVLIDVVGVYDDHTHTDDAHRPDVIASLNANGSIQSGGDGIDSVTYNATLRRYEITFTRVNFHVDDDVAQVTVRASGYTAGYASSQGRLIVDVRDSNGMRQPVSFSFVVWDLE